MSELRHRMKEDMQLKGFAPTTQKVYINSVAGIAIHYNLPPEQLTENQLRQYFLYLINDKKVSQGTFKTQFYGIKFLYTVTLNRPWTVFDLVHPKKRVKLPVVLSIEEVRKILNQVRNPKIRMCLIITYSCGLRPTEGRKLTIDDIDSERMLVWVRNGKGGKDRCAPLAQHILTLLREYWQNYNPQKPWLFPSPKGDTFLSASGVSKVFVAARKESGVSKKATVHTLRHSYATHLLESDVDLRSIQKILGHKSPQTTAIYTHITRKKMASLRATVEKLISNF